MKKLKWIKYEDEQCSNQERGPDWYLADTSLDMTGGDVEIQRFPISLIYDTGKKEVRIYLGDCDCDAIKFICVKVDSLDKIKIGNWEKD